MFMTGNHAGSVYLKVDIFNHLKFIHFQSADNVIRVNFQYEPCRTFPTNVSDATCAFARIVYTV